MLSLTSEELWLRMPYILQFFIIPFTLSPPKYEFFLNLKAPSNNMLHCMFSN